MKIKILIIYLFNIYNIYSINLSSFGDQILINEKKPLINEAISELLTRNIKELSYVRKNEETISHVFSVYNGGQFIINNKLVNGNFTNVDNMQFIFNNQQVKVYEIKSRKIMGGNLPKFSYVTFQDTPRELVFSHLLYNSTSSLQRYLEHVKYSILIDHNTTLYNALYNIFIHLIAELNNPQTLIFRSIDIRAIDLGISMELNNLYNLFILGKFMLDTTDQDNNEEVLSYAPMNKVTINSKIYYLHSKNNNFLLGFTKADVMSNLDLGSIIVSCVDKCRIIGQVTSIDEVEVTRNDAEIIGINLPENTDNNNIKLKIFSIELLFITNLLNSYQFRSTTDFNYIAIDLNTKEKKINELNPFKESLDPLSEMLKSTRLITNRYPCMFIHRNFSSPCSSKIVETIFIPQTMPKSVEQSINPKRSRKEFDSASSEDKVQPNITSLSTDKKKSDQLALSTDRGTKRIIVAGERKILINPKRSRKEFDSASSEDKVQPNITSLSTDKKKSDQLALSTDRGTKRIIVEGERKILINPKRSRKELDSASSEDKVQPNITSLSTDKNESEQLAPLIDRGTKRIIVEGEREILINPKRSRKELDSASSEDKVQPNITSLSTDKNESEQLAPLIDRGTTQTTESVSKQTEQLPSNSQRDNTKKESTRSKSIFTNVSLKNLVNDCYTVITKIILNDKIESLSGSAEQDLSKKDGDSYLMSIKGIKLSAAELNGKFHVFILDQVDQYSVALLDSNNKYIFSFNCLRPKYAPNVKIDNDEEKRLFPSSGSRDESSNTNGDNLESVKGNNLYYVSKFSSQQLLKQNDLEEGVYATTDRKYFQVIDKDITQIELKNELEDMSIYHDRQVIDNSVFIKIFNRYISNYEELTKQLSKNKLIKRDCCLKNTVMYYDSDIQFNKNLTKRQQIEILNKNNLNPGFYKTNDDLFIEVSSDHKYNIQDEPQLEHKYEPIDIKLKRKYLSDNEKLDILDRYQEKSYKEFKNGVYKSKDQIYFQVIEGKKIILEPNYTPQNQPSFKNNTQVLESKFVKLFNRFVTSSEVELFPEGTTNNYTMEPIDYINVWRYDQKDDNTVFILDSIKIPVKNNDSYILNTQEHKNEQLTESHLLNGHNYEWLKSKIKDLTKDHRK